MKPGKYTIKELFTNREVEQIVIPEIQRDYVWKKEQVEGLMNSLLSDFIKFDTETINVTADNEEIKNLFINYYKKQQFASNIGFIYAYNDAEYKGKYFLIDGQQRVTTVYLLLLNLFISIDEKADFENKYFKDDRLKIDFKVRETSHNFFKKFIRFCLDNNLDETVDFKVDFIDKLTSQYWYYSEYTNDKTIQSIITNYVVINSFIQTNNLNSKNFLNYILDYVDCWYFDTNISEQGEELYIYMNARGEQIQNNENIKADLLGALNDVNVDLVSNREDYRYEKNVVGLKNYWGKKWEDWQDFFWINRGENENADNGFNEFLRWVQIVSMTKNTVIDPNNENENSIDKKEIIEVIKWEKKGIKIDVKYLELIEIEKYINALIFIFDKSNFEFVKETYKEHDLNLQFIIESNWIEGFSNISKAKLNQISQIDCFRFLPLLEFAMQQLENEQHNGIETYRFARFLYNLSRINNVSKAANVNCINAIKLVSSLDGKIDNILKISNVSKTIFSVEEKTKLYLYVNPPSGLSRVDLEQIFWKSEDLEVLKGEILIIFKYINFQLNDDSTFDINEFTSLSNVFKFVFEKKVSDLFRKALLANEDYKIYESYTYSLGMNRYHLCDTLDEWNLLLNRSIAIKPLLVRLQYKESINDELKAIIDEEINLISDWRLKYLKSDLSTLKFSEEKRICVKGDNVFLMKKKIAHNEGFFKKLV
jgi:hypothetical protein